MVARKNQTIRHVPRFSSTDWPEASGLSLGKTKDMMVAGIKKFTAAGMKRVKNSVKFRSMFTTFYDRYGESGNTHGEEEKFLCFANKRALRVGF